MSYSALTRGQLRSIQVQRGKRNDFDRRILRAQLVDEQLGIADDHQRRIASADRPLRGGDGGIGRDGADPITQLCRLARLHALQHQRR